MFAVGSTDEHPAMSNQHHAAASSGALQLIEQSGLFDADYYVACNPDMAEQRAETLAHYHAYGWREGRKPNLYFDPGWYLAQNPDVAAEGIDPLLHYLVCGEAEGRRPSGWFDPAWYKATYSVPEGMHALRHYLLHRADGSVSAMAEFDSPFYLKAYPDVAAAGLDPLEHYMVQGFREARKPFRYYGAPATKRSRRLPTSRHDRPAGLCSVTYGSCRPFPL